MSKKIIKTDKTSLPVGPYNQAVSIGNLIYTAGQIPLDKQGNMVPGGIKEQTEQVIQNLIAVLTHGGSSHCMHCTGMKNLPFTGTVAGS